MDTWGLLGQALECSVCLEQLDATSKVLPCQHTFCQKCLVDIINTRKELRCPECRVLVTVPFNSLPPNILLMRILEGIKKIPPNSSSGDLIELPSSPKKESQPVTDPFSLFSQVNTSIESGISSSGVTFSSAALPTITRALSQNASQNPFLTPRSQPCTASSIFRSISTSVSQSMPERSTPTRISVSDFISQLSSCSSTSVVHSVSSSNSLPHQPVGGENTLEFLSSLNRNLTISDSLPTSTTSPFSSTASSSFLSQVQRTTSTDTHSMSINGTCSTQPTYTLAGTSSATQTCMSVLNNLSNPVSNSGKIGSSTNSQSEPSLSSLLVNISESQMVESVSTLNRDESPSVNIRPSMLRQVSTKSQKESQSSGISLHPYVPPLNIQAKALYTYDGKEARDLKFKKGDAITICKQIDENWYQGELDGHFGFVPASYVKLLEPPSSHIPQCKALYDFKMVSEEERSCLMFSKGETITVLRRIDDNWAEGKLNTHIGIFPLSFVELNDAAKTLIRLSGSVAPNSLHLSAGISSTTLTPTTITPSTTSITTSLTPSPSHTSPQTAQTSSVVRMGENEQKLAAKKHSLTDTQSRPPFTSNPSANASSPPVTNRVSSGSSSTNTSSLKSSSASDQGKRTVSSRPQSHSEADVRMRSFTLASLENLKLYIALYSYRPRKADELELKKGQLYSVSEKCQDGWCKGRCLTSDKIGVFPGNYVQIADVQTISAFLSRSSRALSNISGSQVSSTTIKTSPAHGSNMISYARPKSTSFTTQPQTGTAGDGRNVTNGSVCPPELPPRSITASGKHLIASTSQFQNSCQERCSASDSIICRSSPCSSPVSHLGDKRSVTKDPCSTNGGISLMRKLASGKRKTKSPPLLSIDNPVFEDSNPNINRNKYNVSNDDPEKILESTAKSTKQPAPLVRERYRCVVPYPANSGYELELQVGDIVYVHRKREDGWYKGTLQRTGKTGLFPSIFVESC